MKTISFIYRISLIAIIFGIIAEVLTMVKIEGRLSQILNLGHTLAIVFVFGGVYVAVLTWTLEDVRQNLKTLSPRMKSLYLVMKASMALTIPLIALLVVFVLWKILINIDLVTIFHGAVEELKH